MHILLFNIGLILLAASQVIINWEAIKGYLSEINHWFNTGDPEIVYPVAIITGLLVATAASWVMM